MALLMVQVVLCTAALCVCYIITTSHTGVPVSIKGVPVSVNIVTGFVLIANSLVEILQVLQ